MTKLMVALDTKDLNEAVQWAAWTEDYVDGYKVGLEFFLANGPDGYRLIGMLNKPIMLDLKLHDIPNTVAGAVKALLPLRPTFLTIHAQGGYKMIEAAHDAAGKSEDRPQIIVVTQLTSTIGDSNVVMHWAAEAEQAGADGIVCSGLHTASLRRFLDDPSFLIMNPGIREPGATADDQVQTVTAKSAKQSGADWIVVGRPITKAPHVAEAAARFRSELDQA